MMDQCPKGMMTTVAGSGEPGCRGDGALATAACLNEPKNISFDAAGNLLITDSENHAIRRVMRSSGIIETVAGCTTQQPLPVESSSSPTVSDETEEEIDPLADVEDIPGKAYTQTPDLSNGAIYYRARYGKRSFLW